MLYKVFATPRFTILALIIILALAGCYSLLPEDRQREVRIGHKAAQQGYENANPFLTEKAPRYRIRDILKFGLDIDLIYDLLGDPAHIDTYEGTHQRLTYIGSKADMLFVYINEGKVTHWQGATDAL